MGKGFERWYEDTTETVQDDKEKQEEGVMIQDAVIVGEKKKAYLQFVVYITIVIIFVFLFYIMYLPSLHESLYIDRGTSYTPIVETDTVIKLQKDFASQPEGRTEIQLQGELSQANIINVYTEVTKYTLVHNDKHAVIYTDTKQIVYDVNQLKEWKLIE